MDPNEDSAFPNPKDMAPLPPILILPAELKLEILSHLGPASHSHLRETCTSFRSFISPVSKKDIFADKRLHRKWLADPDMRKGNYIWLDSRSASCFKLCCACERLAKTKLGTVASFRASVREMDILCNTCSGTGSAAIKVKDTFVDLAGTGS
jgi:hypothetical protein